MRLDKFLKVSRLIKRRTVAHDACGTDHVTVNGKVAKPSCDIKENDIIEITFGERTVKLRVLEVREHTLKADASSMYEIISQ
jgi:ribosomal 50S subunit-recycling heat shock protein